MRGAADPGCRKMVGVPDGATVSSLVQASAKGDEAAWNELVRRYAPLVLAVTRSYQLSSADTQDVSQTVWLRLVEHVADLREPEALPGWLVTTARRECDRCLKRAHKILPVDPQASTAVTRGTAADADAGILRAELRQALRDGLNELPARDQWLLRLRADDPPKSYQEISRLLDMPVGSIGPSLRRSLDRLRHTSAVRAYLAAAGQAGQAGAQPS